MPKLCIETPRQYRFIKTLLERGMVSVRNMRDIIGALNVPEIRRQLKGLGWSSLYIGCCRKPITDRDGKRCRPGYYYLTDEAVPIAVGLINEWEAATPHSGLPESTKNQLPIL